MRAPHVRTSIVATALLLGAILAACGGGGGGGTSPSLTSDSSSIPPNTQVNTSFTGPTSQLSVTISIPRHTESAAEVAARRTRIQAIYGKKTANASIRTMANTAASPQIRALGQKLNARATALEKSTGRSPEYVSSGTDYMEVDVYSGSTLIQDSTQECFVSASTCSDTITVPVGTGYTVSMYLYDYCYYLLSAGVANNVSVTAGQNNPLTINLDGVVAFLDVTSTASSVVFGGGTQTVPVGVVPVDADYNTITTPGSLINNAFVPVTGATLTLASAYTDVTPTTPQSLPVPAPAQSPPTAFEFGPATYTYTGTGSEPSVQWNVAEVASGNPIITTVPYLGTDAQNETQSYSVGVVPRSIFIGADGSYTIPTINGFPAYAVSTSAPSMSTTTSVEFAAPTPAAIQVGLSVSANFNDAGAALTLSNDGCSNGIVEGSLTSSFPSPTPSTPPVPGATMPPSGNYAFTFDASTSQGAGQCSFTITDSNNLSAVTTLYVDSTTLTVSGKARRK